MIFSSACVPHFLDFISIAFRISFPRLSTRLRSATKNFELEMVKKNIRLNMFFRWQELIESCARYYQKIRWFEWSLSFSLSLPLCWYVNLYLQENILVPMIRSLLLNLTYRNVPDEEHYLPTPNINKSCKILKLCANEA